MIPSSFFPSLFREIMGNDLLDRNSDFRLGTFNAHLLKRVRASDTADRAMRWLSVLTTGHRLLPHYALFLPRLLTFKKRSISIAQPYLLMKQILVNHLHIVVHSTYRSLIFLFKIKYENDYFSHTSETNLVTINRHIDNCTACKPNRNPHHSPRVVKIKK